MYVGLEQRKADLIKRRVHVLGPQLAVPAEAAENLLKALG
jgi:hypothetical protein